MFCLEESGPMADAIRRPAVPVVSLHRRPGFRPWLALRLSRALRRHGTQLVHTHNSAAAFYGALAGKLCRLPVIHTKHGTNRAPMRAQERLNRLAFLMTDHVVSVNPSLRALSRREGVRLDRSSVIDNGVDLTRFDAGATARRRARDELGLPRDAFVVGSVARLVHEKNQALLLESFADVARAGDGAEDAYLVILGDGPLRGQLQAQADGLRVGERVLLAGARGGVERLLPAFDVFVLSSDAEGLPVALLEAMAAGLPPVVTSVGAMPEAVAHGEAGKVVTPRSRADLCSAVLDLWRLPSERARLGAAARDRVESRYSAARMASAYEAVYASCLRASAR